MQPKCGAVLSVRQAEPPFPDAESLQEALDLLGFGDDCNGSRIRFVHLSDHQISAVAEKLVSDKAGLPSDLIFGNVMMAHFTVSRCVLADELIAKLGTSAFDLVIVQPSPDGLADDVIALLRATVATVMRRDLRREVLDTDRESSDAEADEQVEDLLKNKYL